MVCRPKWPFYSWIVILDCWDRLYTGYVLRVELPVQMKLCPIFVRDVGSPDIHECSHRLMGSQRTPEIWGVTGFATQDCEASESVVAAPRSGGGNIGTRGHDACHLSFLIRG